MKTPRNALNREAHELLDAARAGKEVPVWQIAAALELTGDLDEGDSSVQSWVSAGCWERVGAPLMARAGVWDGLLSC